MDGQNYVIFHAGTDNSYMNSTANFRGGDVGATFIDLYFQGSTAATDTISGYDKVRLTVTATFEEAAFEAVAGALSGNKNPVMVIADDNKSLYIEDHITAVASITLGSRVQTRIVESIAGAKNIEASDSGKVFMVSQGAAYAITLPTVAQAGAGWMATFILEAQASNAVTLIPDATEDTMRGMVHSADGAAGIGVETGVDTLTFVSGTAKNGDRVEVLCTGSFFEVQAFVHDADHITFA